MTRSLVHRGPDGLGVWSNGEVALGHTRLSIIDIAGGRQPLIATGQSGNELALTYNGELYNYRELRHLLKKRGHRFETESDSEVILRAYDEWGTHCVDHFIGMFAFGVWDGRERTLFLARDPLGVKPLYYYTTASGIVFGSEEKALLAHPEVPAVLDHAGLAELFYLVPMGQPESTVFRGLRQLPPGHTLTVTPDHTSLQCYWRLDARPHLDDETTTVRKVRELVENAVRGQLIADVPLGAMLSGGVDSSAVAAIAAEQCPGLPTFVIDYLSTATNYSSSGLHVDTDAPWAEKVSASLGSRHQTYCVSADDLLAANETTVTAWDRPTYSTINTSLYLLFRYIAAAGVRTVLTGEGADEAFAGYHWWHDTQDGLPWSATYAPASELLRKDWRAGIDPVGYLRSYYDDARSRIPVLPRESAQERRAREISWLTYTYYLNFLLHRVDRMSMAAGVEARVPFCDHRLVQYCWNIPWTMKNSQIEKALLRRAVSHLLPEEITWRRKSGYPAAQMPEYQQALSKIIVELLAAPTLPLWDIVDRAAVRELLKRADDDFRNWTTLNQISYVIQIHHWLTRSKIQLA